MTQDYNFGLNAVIQFKVASILLPVSACGCIISVCYFGESTLRRLEEELNLDCFSGSYGLMLSRARVFAQQR